jgi:hypothetical protein
MVLSVAFFSFSQLFRVSQPKRENVYVFYKWTFIPLRILLSIICFPFGLISWLMPKTKIKEFV